MKKLIAVFMLMVLLGVTSAYAENFDLMAGQNMDVGNVEVTHDGTNLYVTFSLTGPWGFDEIHLHVATNVYDGGMPLTGSDCPKVGKFEWGDDESPIDTSYVIPLSSIPVTLGNAVYIAAHAAISYEDTIIYEESAWGEDGGLNFDCKNWATYISYNLGD